MPIRIIRHETVVDGEPLHCGSIEVKYDDGRPPVYFYWDDIAGRRLRVDAMNQEQAVEKAKALAREG